MEVDISPPSTQLHSQPTDDETQGDEPIYCICRTSDESRFMVQCDRCQEWFHIDCVGLTKREATKMEFYHCPTCQDVQLDDEGKPIISIHSNVVGVVIDDKDIRERIKTAQQNFVGVEILPLKSFITQCSRAACLRLCQAGSLYCSKECENHSDSLSLDLSNLPAVSSTTNTPLLSPFETELTNSKSIPLDPVRKMVVIKFTSALHEAWERFDGDKDGLPESDALEPLAIRMEHALFMAKAAHLKNGKRAPNEPYKTQFMHIVHNLKDAKNVKFHRRILSGKLTPDMLANMASEAMVNEHVKSMAKELKLKGLQETVIQDVHDLSFVKKTHKGEEFTHDAHKNTLRIDTENKESVSSEVGVDALDAVLFKLDGVDAMVVERMPSLSTTPMLSPSERRFSSDTYFPTDVAALLKKPHTPDVSDDHTMVMEDDATVWEGMICMKDVADVACSAIQIGGPTIHDKRAWEETLAADMIIDGRIGQSAVHKYVDAQQLAGKDILILQFHVNPFDEEALQQYMVLWEYFYSKSRYGVVGGLKFVTVKDIYLLPLAEGDAVPTFMQVATSKHPVQSSTLYGVVIKSNKRKAPSQPPSRRPNSSARKDVRHASAPTVVHPSYTLEQMAAYAVPPPLPVPNAQGVFNLEPTYAPPLPPSNIPYYQPNQHWQ